MRNADWYYDDSRQVGVDFADPAQVATYDARQQATDAAAAALLGELGVRPGDAFVDIGCGTGVLACQAALAGCKVHAIDISAEMLAATQRRASRLNAPAPDLQRAGFLSFELPERSIDFVATQYALHHLADFWKLVALQRIFECLKPGGELFVRDVVFSCDASELEQTVEAWLAWMQEHRGYSRTETATHIREEHSTFAWVMEGLIQRAGFEVRSVAYAQGVYATYTCRRPRSA